MLFDIKPAAHKHSLDSYVFNFNLRDGNRFYEIFLFSFSKISSTESFSGLKTKAIAFADWETDLQLY